MVLLIYSLAVDCGAPPEPEYGFVQYTGTKLGSVASYSCTCGYQLVGDTVKVCSGSGLWSGNSTQCISKYLSSITIGLLLL